MCSVVLYCVSMLGSTIASSDLLCNPVLDEIDNNNSNNNNAGISDAGLVSAVLHTKEFKDPCMGAAGGKGKGDPDIGSRRGGAMVLQPQLILRVFHRILIFAIQILFCQSISST